MTASKFEDIPETWIKATQLAARFVDVSRVRVECMAAFIGLSVDGLNAKVVDNVELYLSPEAAGLVERELTSRGAQLDPYTRYKRRCARLEELAGELNGGALMRDYIACNGQGSHATGWDTGQFERWLIGVMRRALANDGEQ